MQFKSAVNQSCAAKLFYLVQVSRMMNNLVLSSASTLLSLFKFLLLL